MGRARGAAAKGRPTTDEDLRHIRADFRAGRIPRVIIVAGDDEFRRTEVARRIPGWIVPGEEQSLAVCVLDGRDVCPAEILGQVDSAALPFVDVTRRVVLVRECPYFEDKAPKEIRSLQERIQAGLPGDMTLVLESPAPEPKGAFFQACEAAGLVLRLAKPSRPADVASFVSERFRYAGVTIEPDALDALIALASPDSGLLNSEVRKLISFVGERGQVGLEDVRTLVSRTKEAVVFDLTDALGRRDVGRALSALRDLMHQGQSGIGIVALLAGRLRLLLVACALMERGLIAPGLARASRCDEEFKREWTSTAERVKSHMPEDRAANLAAQHVFVVYKTLREARSFSTEQLARGLRAAADADVALKTTTGLSETDILENLVLGLCAPAAMAPAGARPVLSGGC
jgi:DNA polymerase-3 subunit delta